ncbi:MAG: RNA 2',3'-cyclic phosphodiesterase [Melioribacteraceae bacterium]|nr:RNA 2',3'-cyclic phosphodiesterase [Melioribacteraceae bacterium]
MKNRLFIALEIPDTVKDAIIKLRDFVYPNDGKVRWESSDKLHITLKFLGNVQDILIPKIIEEIYRISDDAGAFRVCFNRFGMFERNGKPSVIWAGTRPEGELMKLQFKIDDSMSKMGFSKESKKFKSHLTLLRVKGGENYNYLIKFKNYKYDDIIFSADEISLIKSVLKPAGSEYTKISGFNLN